MTEVDVAARPATGPSSTSVRVSIIRVGHDPIVVDWPVEWRIPVAGEIIRLAEVGVIEVARVIWEHEGGTVLLWT